ncbi:MAG: glycosyltransferase family 39 protein [Elusimicrobiota bacterium]
MYFLVYPAVIEESATYDETIHITAGYSYWHTGILRLNIYDHPPFGEMITTLPLKLITPQPGFPEDSYAWINKMQYTVSDEFVYKNTLPAENILFPTRMAVVGLSALLATILVLWSSQLYGTYAGILAGTLYLFCPNMLTHGHLVTTDLPGTLFFVSTFYFLYLYYRRQTNISAGLTGIMAGLALASKFSNIIIFPALFILLLFFPPRSNAADVKPKIFWHILLFTIFTGLTISVCYGFTQTQLYIDGLTRVFSDISSRGRSSFLAGQYSTAGWWYYFLLAFFWKTPIPVMILLIYRIVTLFTQKPRGIHYREEWLILIPLLLFTASALTQKLNIGIRHILPAYPLLYLWVSGILMHDNPRGDKPDTRHLLVILPLLAWMIFSTVNIRPYYITYFNELVGGPKNGYKYLVDSNLDWGQDLKRLSVYLKTQNVDDIYLSYFGTANPGYYGIKYVNTGFVSSLDRPHTSVNLPNGKKELVAISATNLQAVYFADKELYAWAKKIVPLTVVGNTIFVYDITRSVEAHRWLVQMFNTVGDTQRAAREYTRLRELGQMKG